MLANNKSSGIAVQCSEFAKFPVEKAPARCPLANLFLHRGPEFHYSPKDTDFRCRCAVPKTSRCRENCEMHSGALIAKTREPGTPALVHLTSHFARWSGRSSCTSRSMSFNRPHGRKSKNF